MVFLGTSTSKGLTHSTLKTSNAMSKETLKLICLVHYRCSNEAGVLNSFMTYGLKSSPDKEGMRCRYLLSTGIL